MPESAIVIGTGIAGLATARALAVRGYDVTVFERTGKAIGASVRNFGMIWPVGQPDGEMFERAILSRGIWEQVCKDANIWYDPVGSMHVAYTNEEWQVLEELSEIYAHRNYALLQPDAVRAKSSFIVQEGLRGGLYSPDEMIVDPRKAIAALPRWLNEKYGVQFIWNKAITDIAYPAVYAGKDTWEADEIYVCSGADFETLYPELFIATDISKCKLQMMRLAAPPGQSRIGPALCGGLSLLHYQSFKAAVSQSLLRKKIEAEMPLYVQWGIHVMVSQNESGELTVGDSHEYGLTHDPFDRQCINQMILDYLQQFMNLENDQVIETWNGIYPKLMNGKNDMVIQPEQGVMIINGLGGAGMTLGFGLAEQIIAGR
ncbi:MAG: TIGR03364 family FAD-dependent oxidoreductase [Terrimonas sp.]|nr:TIGR03364 family FAD-dependent oxidoreductase [Terrimonas sp.]